MQSDAFASLFDLKKSDEWLSSSQDVPTSESAICRDYLRNVCKRGKKCRYKHPSQEECDKLRIDRNEPIFCHDYRNGACRRPACKFLHLTKDEIEAYRLNGSLPSTQGPFHSTESPVDAKIPICKDYLNHNCHRGSTCKFRHFKIQPLEPSSQVAQALQSLPNASQHDQSLEIVSQNGQLYMPQSFNYSLHQPCSSIGGGTMSSSLPAAISSSTFLLPQHQSYNYAQLPVTAVTSDVITTPVASDLLLPISQTVIVAPSVVEPSSGQREFAPLQNSHTTINVVQQHPTPGLHISSQPPSLAAAVQTITLATSDPHKNYPQMYAQIPTANPTSTHHLAVRSVTAAGRSATIVDTTASALHPLPSSIVVPTASRVYYDANTETRVVVSSPSTACISASNVDNSAAPHVLSPPRHNPSTAMVAAAAAAGYIAQHLPALQQQQAQQSLADTNRLPSVSAAAAAAAAAASALVGHSSSVANQQSQDLAPAGPVPVLHHAGMQMSIVETSSPLVASRDHLPESTARIHFASHSVSAAGALPSPSGASTNNSVSLFLHPSSAEMISRPTRLVSLPTSYITGAAITPTTTSAVLDLISPSSHSGVATVAATAMPAISVLTNPVDLQPSLTRSHRIVTPASAGAFHTFVTNNAAHGRYVRVANCQLWKTGAMADGANARQGCANLSGTAQSMTLTIPVSLSNATVSIPASVCSVSSGLTRAQLLNNVGIGYPTPVISSSSPACSTAVHQHHLRAICHSTLEQEQEANNAAAVAAAAACFGAAAAAASHVAAAANSSSVVNPSSVAGRQSGMAAVNLGHPHQSVSTSAAVAAAAAAAVAAVVSSAPSGNPSAVASRLPVTASLASTSAATDLSLWKSTGAVISSVSRAAMATHVSPGLTDTKPSNSNPINQNLRSDPSRSLIEPKGRFFRTCHKQRPENARYLESGSEEVFAPPVSAGLLQPTIVVSTAPILSNVENSQHALVSFNSATYTMTTAAAAAAAMAAAAAVEHQQQKIAAAALATSAASVVNCAQIDHDGLIPDANLQLQRTSPASLSTSSSIPSPTSYALKETLPSQCNGLAASRKGVHERRFKSRQKLKRGVTESPLMYTESVSSAVEQHVFSQHYLPVSANRSHKAYRQNRRLRRPRQHRFLAHNLSVKESEDYDDDDDDDDDDDVAVYDDLDVDVDFDDEEVVVDPVVSLAREKKCFAHQFAAFSDHGQVEKKIKNKSEPTDPMFLFSTAKRNCVLIDPIVPFNYVSISSVAPDLRLSSPPQTAWTSQFGRCKTSSSIQSSATACIQAASAVTSSLYRRGRSLERIPEHTIFQSTRRSKSVPSKFLFYQTFDTASIRASIALASMENPSEFTCYRGNFPTCSEASIVESSTHSWASRRASGNDLAADAIHEVPRHSGRFSLKRSGGQSTAARKRKLIDSRPCLELESEFDEEFCDEPDFYLPIYNQSAKEFHGERRYAATAVAFMDDDVAAASSQTTSENAVTSVARHPVKAYTKRLCSLKHENSRLRIQVQSLLDQRNELRTANQFLAKQNARLRNYNKRAVNAAVRAAAEQAASEGHRLRHQQQQSSSVARRSTNLLSVAVRQVTSK